MIAASANWRGRPMRLDVIDNSGATSMIAELRKELGACRSARMATASLTRGGIEFIEEAVSDSSGNLRVRLLVGLYNGHTEAAALRGLLGLQRRYGQYIEIRIARNERFHWKTYLFESRGRAVAFVAFSSINFDAASSTILPHLPFSMMSMEKALGGFSYEPLTTG